MGFRKRPPSMMRGGDDVAIYLTRGAFRNPTRDYSRIVALGTVGSDPEAAEVAIAGELYSYRCNLQVVTQMEIRKGLPFGPLVEALDFVRNKRAWAAYMRRTVVSVLPSDFTLIANAFAAAQARGD